MSLAIFALAVQIAIFTMINTHQTGKSYSVLPNDSGIGRVRPAPSTFSGSQSSDF